jgi:hypothetical protein
MCVAFCYDFRTLMYSVDGDGGYFQGEFHSH